MVDNLYLAALREQSLPFRIEEFVNHKIKEIADKTLVPAIKNEAKSKKMPQRYIDGIHSEFDGKELWIWVDFKGKKGEPIDVFFEDGTKDHFIKPKNKKALSWIKPGSIGIAGGTRFFSKGHWVRGIAARHIFQNGLKKGYPEFKKRLREEIEEYLEETTLFG